MTTAPIRTPDEFARVFSVSRETLEKLVQYAALLERWQRTLNLVAPATIPELWHRHMADSAQLAAFVPATARTLVDLGSGAGFPGLVLAVLLDGRGVKVTLVESDQRKAAFLGEVMRQIRTPMEIVSLRIENPTIQDRILTPDVVTARALAPAERLFELAAAYFSADTVGLFLKGQDVERELHDARQRFQFDVELHPSLTSDEGRIAIVRNLKARTQGGAA